MKKFTTYLIFYLAAALSLSAAMPRNCIYIFDCTKSMAGYNGAPNIWGETKANLKSKIEEQAPNTKITIIPFQDKVYAPISFQRAEFNDNKWKDIEKTFDSYIQNVTNTNITDSWKRGETFIEPNRNNYLYLMTDGVETGGTDKLTKALREFCAKISESNLRDRVQGYYVMLTNNAAIDHNLAEIFEECKNLFIVDPNTSTGFGGFGNQDYISINTRNLPVEFELQFSDPGTYDAIVDNPMHQIKTYIKSGKMSNGKAVLVFENSFGDDLYSLIHSIDSEEVDYTIEVTSTQCHVLNPQINIHLTNVPESILTLGVDNHGTDIGEVTTHGSFWWSKASEPDTLTIDLTPKFNEQALANRSSATFQLTPTTENQDFEILYNGEAIKDNIFTVTARDSKATLSIIVNHESSEGELGYNLACKDEHELDCINTSQAEDFSTVLTFTHLTEINPMKLAVLIIAAVILIALLLWFLILKEQFFPTIKKANRLTITDPYFSSKKIKGAYKVILSNKPYQQGFLSKIFKGKIISEVNDVWTSPCTLTAARKGVRFSGREFMASPSAVMTKMQQYEIISQQGNNKIKIEIN